MPSGRWLGLVLLGGEQEEQGPGEIVLPPGVVAELLGGVVWFPEVSDPQASLAERANVVLQRPVVGRDFLGEAIPSTLNRWLILRGEKYVSPGLICPEHSGQGICG
jgi:hypothetical protein